MYSGYGILVPIIWLFSVMAVSMTLNNYKWIDWINIDSSLGMIIAGGLYLMFERLLPKETKEMPIETGTRWKIKTKNRFCLLDFESWAIISNIFAVAVLIYGVYHFGADKINTISWIMAITLGITALTTAVFLIVRRFSLRRKLKIQKDFIDLNKEKLEKEGLLTATLGGHYVIPRVDIFGDSEAGKIQDKLLDYVEKKYGTKSTASAGTNSMYWVFFINGKEVNFSVVGDKINTANSLDSGTKWIIRVEEYEPTAFINELSKEFVEKNRVRRVMYDGKVRIQFKDTEILDNSELKI